MTGKRPLCTRRPIDREPVQFVIRGNQNKQLIEILTRNARIPIDGEWSKSLLRSSACNSHSLLQVKKRKENRLPFDHHYINNINTQFHSQNRLESNSETNDHHHEERIVGSELLLFFLAVIAHPQFGSSPNQKWIVWSRHQHVSHTHALLLLLHYYYLKYYWIPLSIFHNKTRSGSDATDDDHTDHQPPWWS